MATLGRDVVNQALYKGGITGRGITPSSADTQDALADLNDMIDEWNIQKLLTWNEVTLGIVGDGRVTPYTIGPTGDIPVTPRPNKLYSAFVRQLQNVGSLQVDTPLKIIDAMEEYNRISTKTLSTFPQAVFLDTAMPNGNLYVYPWPAPAGQYGIYVSLRGVIPVITLATDMSSLPKGYVSAMKFNLARRQRQAHGRGMKPDPELNRLANNSLDVLMAGNTQIPEAGMPPSLLQRGSGYNIYSDSFGN